MRLVVKLLDSLRADTESLVGLVARLAGSPVCPQALKKRVVLMDIARGIERRHRARFILKRLKIGNHRQHSSARAE